MSSSSESEIKKLNWKNILLSFVLSSPIISLINENTILLWRRIYFGLWIIFFTLEQLLGGFCSYKRKQFSGRWFFLRRNFYLVNYEYKTLEKMLRTKLFLSRRCIDRNKLPAVPSSSHLKWNVGYNTELISNNFYNRP